MIILRATQKVLRHLPPPVASPGESDTALGDWYVNRIMVGRKPILLLVSARSLLPALVPARDVRSLPDRLAEIVANRLRSLGVPSLLIERELSAMDSVLLAKTKDRSVLGFMNDFGQVLPFYFDSDDSIDALLASVEARLEETPCHAGRRQSQSFFPAQKAVELIWSKWGSPDSRA